MDGAIGGTEPRPYGPPAFCCGHNVPATVAARAATVAAKGFAAATTAAALAAAAAAAAGSARGDAIGAATVTVYTAVALPTAVAL